MTTPYDCVIVANGEFPHSMLPLKYLHDASTIIACEKTSRHCRMMELDEKYCDVIIKRWQGFKGKQAIHAETGEAFDGNGAAA